MSEVLRHGHHHCHQGYGSVGAILVLFILLVIITSSFCAWV
ncbi:YjcZ family sporulation protein [Paenibacillus glucanolyticus]|nr:YjcZ family sporulation protein [Paenibacillus glucanolyticus]